MKTTKKIISLILAAALMLGIVAVAANAEGLTTYAGSVLSYTMTSDKTVNGVTEVHPGDTITFSVYMSTNFYSGPNGGEFFLWTADAFEALGENYKALNLASTDNFAHTVTNPADTASYPSTHAAEDYVGIQFTRVYVANVTPVRVVDNELVYEITLKVKDDPSLVGTTATFEMPAGAIKSASQSGRKGMIYQNVNGSVDTPKVAKAYAETTYVPDPIQINIVAAEAPAVACSYDELNAAIAKYDDLTQADYTPASWTESAVEAAYAAAKAVPGDLMVDEAGANQAQIDNAAAALNAAIEKLVKKADKTALAAAINTAVDKTDCTAASVAAYDDALATANSVNADENATQQAVNDATAALNSAIKGLTKLGKCDYSALDAAIALAPEKAEEYYDADLYAAWQAAKADAQAVTRDMVADEAGANQAAINAAADKLVAAYNALVPNALDVTALNDAIAAATTPAYAAEYYDSAAYAAWEAALAAAKAGVTTYTGAADTAANREAVAALAADLTAKFAALVPAFVDLADLEAAIAAAATPEYAEEYYDAAAYAAWEDALAAAKAGVTTYTGAADTENNRVAVKALADDLTAKFAALSATNVDLTALEAAIAAATAPAYAAEFYNATAYAAWEDALAAAKAGVAAYTGAADTAANRDAVAALAADLTAKFAALQPAFVDLAALEAAIAACATPAYSAEFYNTTAYTAWNESLAAAQAGVQAYAGAADTAANRDAVAALAADLTAKFAALQPVYVDLADLKAAIANCATPAMDKEFYDANAYAAWEDAFAAAQAGVATYTNVADNDENRTAVAALENKLTTAYTALRPVYVDVAALEAAVAAYATPAYAQEYYDATAYAAWDAALIAAQAGVGAYTEAADTEANRQAVAALAADLANAYAALEPNFADYKAVEDAAALAATALHELYYTTDSWAAFAVEYDAVKQILADKPAVLPAYSQAFQKTLDDAAAALVEAFNNLAPRETSIINVKALQANYSVNDIVNFEIEIEGIKASKIQLVTSSNKTITIDKSSPSLVSITTNDAGNEVWTISQRIYDDGKADMYVRAKYGNTWESGYYTFEIDAVSPDFSVKSAAVVLNGEEVTEFTTKDKVYLTVVTGDDVVKIQLVNQVTGSTSTYATPAYVNEDGTIVWIVERTYANVKDYAFDIRTRGTTQAWADSGVDLTFSVKKYVVPVEPSTGDATDAIRSVSVANARMVHGNTQVFTVVTDVNASKVRLLNRAGSVVATAKAVTSVQGKEATWVIERVYNATGTYNYTVEALYGETWMTDTDGALTFTVVY